MLKLADTHSDPEPRPLAEQFMRVLADAAADGLVLDDERELHAAFLDAALHGDDDRCRVMIADTEARVGAVKAARRIEEQREAVRQEIASARATYEWHLSAITRTNGDIADRMAQFAAAEAAGDVEKCRELAALAEAAWRGKLRPPEVIEAERRASQKAAMGAYEADQKRRQRDAHVAELRQRCAQGWNVLAEIEARGTVRIGEDGAILYSGQPLDDDLLMAIEWRAADIRDSLRQRWQDRVLIPAAAQAVLCNGRITATGTHKFNGAN